MLLIFRLLGECATAGVYLAWRYATFFNMPSSSDFLHRVRSTGDNNDTFILLKMLKMLEIVFFLLKQMINFLTMIIFFFGVCFLLFVFCFLCFCFLFVFFDTTLVHSLILPTFPVLSGGVPLPMPPRLVLFRNDVVRSLRALFRVREVLYLLVVLVV